MSTQPDEADFLDTVTVADNSDRHRYEAKTGGTVAGVANYRLQDGVITFVHTEVNPAYEGKGVAAKLVRAALDDVRARDLKVVPLCPFVKAAFARHKEYQDLLA